MALSLPLNNIVLTGFMGSGKSTVGRELAGFSGDFRLLGEHANNVANTGMLKNSIVLDSDEIIAFNAGMDVKRIFTLFGEAHFRALERRFCEFVAKNIRGSVISTGGGMPMHIDVGRMGRVVFLYLPLDRILERLNEKEIAKRPLFVDVKKAEALYKSRMPIYRSRADIIIDASASPKAIAKEILERL